MKNPQELREWCEKPNPEKPVYVGYYKGISIHCKDKKTFDEIVKKKEKEHNYFGELEGKNKQEITLTDKVFISIVGVFILACSLCYLW